MVGGGGEWGVEGGKKERGKKREYATKPIAIAMRKRITLSRPIRSRLAIVMMMRSTTRIIRAVFFAASENCAMNCMIPENKMRSDARLIIIFITYSLRHSYINF